MCHLIDFHYGNDDDCVDQVALLEMMHPMLKSERAREKSALQRAQKKKHLSVDPEFTCPLGSIVAPC